MVVLMQPLTIVRVVATALALVATGSAGEQAERRVIKVNAERFSFSPSRIELTAGEEVELKLRSDDTSHGFRIVGMDTNVAIPKRGKGEVSVVLRLDKAGTYRFECNRMCGAGHNFMRGEIVVRDRQTTARPDPTQEQR
jgi:cytochrome c oxidase subunit 2